MGRTGHSAANAGAGPAGTHEVLMRKVLAALTIAGLPFAAITITATPAAAGCSIEDGIDCDVCPITSKVINGVSRKVTGRDAVYCLY